MQAARRALEQFDFAARIELLAVAFDEFGLVVEGIDLASRTRHEELHDALGPGHMVNARRSTACRVNSCAALQVASGTSRNLRQCQARPGRRRSSRGILVGSYQVAPVVCAISISFLGSNRYLTVAALGKNRLLVRGSSINR